MLESYSFLKKLFVAVDKKNILPLLWMVMVFVPFFYSCSDDASSKPGESDANNETIPAVEAVQARYGSLPLSERLSGTVISHNQVAIYPEINGKIAEVLVQNGQSVKKGQPLLRLDDNQYEEQVHQAEAGLRINEARLKQAKAQLNELKARYKRTKTLAEKELTSQMEMETMEAQMASAQADVELAEAQVQQSQSNVKGNKDLLAKTVVRAPIDGTLGQRNAEVGMQVSSNTKLLTIGDLDRLRVEVVLTEHMLDYLEVGQTAHIYPGEAGTGQQVITAKLSRISPFLNSVTRSTEAEIDVANKSTALKPGMFVPVDVLYGESQQATLVPTSAIYTNPNTGEEGIFVATSIGSEVEPAEDSSNADGPASLTQPIDVQFKPIDIIAQGRMEVAVGGLDPGKWIITVGQDLLSVGRNQARVRTSSWNRILTLQGLQRQDLLQKVLDEQEQNNKGQSPSQSTM